MSREVCRNGHECTPENTYVAPDGERRCRPCRRESKARGRAAKKVKRFTLDMPERTPAADWRERAECIKHDPDLWFPNEADHDAINTAQNICFGCPVRDLCLREAVELGIKEGIWGGLLPGSRRRKKQKA